MSRNSNHDDLYKDESDVPEMNEQPYYVARLERTIRNGKYGGQEWLSKLKLSTLKLLDGHEIASDLDLNALKRYDEQTLRNILFMGSIGPNKGYTLANLNSACSVMELHHKLRTDDFTRLPESQADMVADAVHFLIKSKLFEFAPPRLTDFVMRNPGTVDDICEYITEHVPRRDGAHDIDLEHLAEFIDSPTKVLREGVL